MILERMKACIFSVLLAAILLLPSTEGLAAEGDASAKEQLESAYKAMDEVKSGTVEMDFLLDTSVMDAKGKLHMDFQGKPVFGAQGNIHLVMGGLTEPSTMDYPFYAEENDKGYTIYYQKEGKWYKDFTSKEESGKTVKKEEEDPAYQAMLQDLKQCEETVRFGKGDDRQQTYLVTVDGAKLWDAVGKYAKTKVNPKDKDAEAVNSAIDALSAIGDIDYEVTVDKATNHVVSVQADLSKPVGNLVTAVLEKVKMDAQTKMILGSALSNAKLVIQTNGSQYNEIKEIKIPESVVKKAKPAPKDKKEKNEKKDK